MVEALSDADVAVVSTWDDPETRREDHDLPVANVSDEDGLAELLAAVRESLGSGDDATCIG